MNKKHIIAFIAISLLCLFKGSPANAQSELDCGHEVAFNFINGMWTSSDTAQVTTELLRRTYGNRTAKGDRVRYWSMYNYSAGRYSLSDLSELFRQRFNERFGALSDRMELFWDTINSDHSWNSVIISAVPDYEQFLSDFSGAEVEFASYSLAYAVNSPPTQSNYADMEARLYYEIASGQKMIIYSHSQGSLFANIVRDYAANFVAATAVGTIYVAPASITVRGSYTLADNDRVINALGATGPVQAPTDHLPDYSVRRLTPYFGSDRSGHALVQTYLNPAFTPASRINGQVQTAFNALISPQWRIARCPVAS